MYCSYTNLAIDKFDGRAILFAGNIEEEIAMTKKEQESTLTAAWLRENMAYEPSTGEFWWTKTGFGRTVGKRLGSRLWTKGKSYLTMKVAGTVYYAHRIAWLYHYGEWPNGFVDHIDEDRTNNAIENLRIATPSQNAARRPTQRSIAPSRGVFPHGTGYVARLHHDGKREYLGYFSTAAEAQAVYEAKAKEIHGEFAHPEGESVAVRGDYINVAKCEMCGRDGSWGNSDIRHDTTPMGMVCGAICSECWQFTFAFRHDKVELQRKFRLAMAYFDKIEVFDLNDSRHRDVPAVSMSQLAQARKEGRRISLDNSDG